MITEEEISHQNNNIFDLSHPNVEALVGTFNQEKVLVRASSVIVKHLGTFVKPHNFVWSSNWQLEMSL